MRYRYPRPAAALMLATALVVGCSSGPAASGPAQPNATGVGTPAPTAAPTPAPQVAESICDVVTDAEVTAILGGKVAAPNRAQAEPGNCAWTSSDFSVHINIHEDEESTITALRLADRNIEELAVGEGGIYSDVSRGAYLKKGGRVLAVQIVILPAALDRRDVAVAIATAGLARF